MAESKRLKITKVRFNNGPKLNISGIASLAKWLNWYPRKESKSRKHSQKSRKFVLSSWKMNEILLNSVFLMGVILSTYLIHSSFNKCIYFLQFINFINYIPLLKNSYEFIIWNLESKFNKVCYKERLTKFKNEKQWWAQII